ncbi:MAG: 50S ribosomal protein L6 [Patescibacteria group bacterium]|nr:50S ribosomal protein L6 [Patescibacteria group bacterium]
MSRIGKQPIKLEQGVTVEITDGSVKATGPLGELVLAVPDNITVVQKGDEIVVSRKNDSKQTRANHGTIRAILVNMVEGVSKGYKKYLQLVGMGYRAEVKGKDLVMQLGWNHPVEFKVPDGIEFTVKDSVEIEIKGIDKQVVGQCAAKIRSIRKPEPYKGKGIRYSDEVVRRKESKTVKEE